MRVAQHERDLAAFYDIARGEAEKAFGNAEIYLEKYLSAPRHIEFQIFGDRAGRVVHLGERECSIQRRHQKLLEESPSSAVGDELRERMGEAAIKAARSVSYLGAGTIEFLLDSDGQFYFMEMNTRIQVEHPVTEVVYGIDLVRWQIRIAAGERLTVRQEDIRPRGHAIECRINAEDGDNKFAPAAGKLGSVLLPGGPGIRVDTHIFSGAEVPPYYDSLLAKIIAYDRNRASAIARMRRALSETEIKGVTTTVPIHERILESPSFAGANTHVTWLREEVLQPPAA
jgi:acetyl-CoA carboxylase biotin carboxylase subunit